MIKLKIAEKRQAGEILGRSGISQRIIEIAQDIAAGTYKNAIEKAGQISVLVEAASYDEYWDEKAGIGKYIEINIFEELNNGYINREDVVSKVNPFHQRDR